MKTWLNFEGFYGSIHNDLIDGLVEEEETTELDFTKIYYDYGKYIVQFVNENLDTNISFESVNSPNYYNFETDVLDIEISRKDCITVLNYCNQNYRKELREYIDCTTTFKDGFMPCFDYEDYSKSKNRDKLIQAALEIVYNSIKDEFMQFYDANYMYELLSQDDYSLRMAVL